MRRRFLTTWVVVVVLAAAALFVAGCGDDTNAASDATAKPVAETTLTPEQIVAESTAAMQKINSGAFTADVSLAVEGDPAAMTDPTTKQLAQSPITLHVEGASSQKPQAATMDMTIGLMGQNLDLSMIALGGKAWVEYDDVWYTVPQENTKALGQQSSGALPTDQLKDMGIDIEDWDVQWELVETKPLDGVDCYHLAATPDVAKMTDSLMKALEDPKVLEQLGDQAAQVQQLEQQNSKEIEQLKESLEGVGVDLWIETETMYLRQAGLTATMDMSGMKDNQGVESAAIEAKLTMSDFDKPVSAEAPANAKKFDLLMQQLMGGMMGGTGSLTY